MEGPSGINTWSVDGTTTTTHAALRFGAGFKGVVGHKAIPVLSTSADSEVVASFTLTLPQNELTPSSSSLHLETFDPSTGKRLEDTAVRDPSFGQHLFAPISATDNVVTGSVAYGSELVAFNIKTGALLWKQDEPNFVGFVNGVILAVQATNQDNCGTLIGIDPVSGATKFSIPAAQSKPGMAAGRSEHLSHQQ